MLDSLKTTNEVIMGKEFKRQGYSRPYMVTAPKAISAASRYLRSKSKIGKAETTLIETAETETAKTLVKVNEFFSSTWADYRKLIENEELPLFKDYEKIE